MSKNSATKRIALPKGLIWRQGAGGLTLHINVRINGGRYTKSCKTMNVSAARRMLNDLKYEVEHGTYQPKHVVKKEAVAAVAAAASAQDKNRRLLMTFAESVFEKMAFVKSSPKTIGTYRNTMSKLDAYLEGLLGHKPFLDEISHDHIVDYTRWIRDQGCTSNGRGAGMKKPPSDRTICNQLDHMRAVFRRAVQRKLLKENPEEGVGRIKDAYQPRIVHLEEADCTRLCTVATQYDDWIGDQKSGSGPLLKKRGPLFGLVIDMYLRTGMRLDELRHITMDDIHLDGEYPYLEVRKKQVDYNIKVYTSPAAYDLFLQKGTFPHRWPTILKAQAHQLALVYENSYVTARICEYAWRPKTTGRKIPISQSLQDSFARILAYRKAFIAEHGLIDTPWLFPDETGMPWRFKMARVMFDCCRQAGIDPICTHGLRHTFGTMLRNKKVSFPTMQKLMGHSDIKQTMIYAHYTENEGKDAIGSIDF